MDVKLMMMTTTTTTRTTTTTTRRTTRTTRTTMMNQFIFVDPFKFGDINSFLCLIMVENYSDFSSFFIDLSLSRLLN